MKIVTKGYLCSILLAVGMMLSHYSYGRAGGIKPDSFPKEGQPCPELVLKLEHAPVAQVSTKDYQGKWLVLFFWSRHCASSFTHFKELEEVQHAYNDAVEIITLTYEGKEERIIDSVYRKTYGYTFPIAFDNKAIETFGIASFSYTVVVDPSGIIRNISMDLDVPGMQAIMKGEQPALLDTQNHRQRAAMMDTYDVRTPFLVNGNGGKDTDFLYRSVLSKWNDTIRPQGNFNLEFDKTNRQVLVSCVDLSRLYRIAYGPLKLMIPPDSSYETYWYHPVLEKGVDSTSFGWEYSKTPDLYVYSLIVPDENIKLSTLQEMMQRDLMNYFGYQVRVETRKMPYWSITASKETERLLKSAGGEPHSEGPSIVQYTMINRQMANLVRLLWGYHQNEPPIIDETGITYAIDITLEGIFKDMKSMQAALARYGLSLTLKERDFKVIVISAPE